MGTNTYNHETTYKTTNVWNENMEELNGTGHNKVVWNNSTGNTTTTGWAIRGSGALPDDILDITIPEGTSIFAMGQTIPAKVTIYRSGTGSDMQTISGVVALTYKGYVKDNNGNYFNVFSMGTVDAGPDYNDGVDYNKSTYVTAVNQAIGKKGRTIGLVETFPQVNMSSTTLIKDVMNDVHCFLAGTLINTPEGYKKVETLQIDDKILALVNDQLTKRKIVSVRKSTIIVRNQDQYPVCIQKDAISPNVPFQDLHITAEHCLFLNNAFIPAYMLVNDRSIFWDKKQNHYTVYHIETEDHSIVDSNGLLSESFLNTTANPSQSDNSIPKTWEKDAAAPLVVTREFVEPIYNTILDKAIHDNIPSKMEKPNLTQEADFHIITNTNVSLYPYAINKNRYFFKLPDDTQEVNFVSAASRPYDVIGHFVNDRRYLGVLVGEVYILDTHDKHMVNTHLTNKDLTGWNNIEPVPYRWTNGNALLPLGKALKTNSILVVEVKETNSYINETPLRKLYA